MSHFAEIDKTGQVLRVIVAEQDYIDTRPGKWVQCSYNTAGGVHKFSRTPLRKNYPGAGWTYDAVRDAFIGPQPEGDWILDEDSCLWVRPAGYVPPDTKPPFAT